MALNSGFHCSQIIHTQKQHCSLGAQFKDRDYLADGCLEHELHQQDYWDLHAPYELQPFLEALK